MRYKLVIFVFLNLCGGYSSSWGFCLPSCRQYPLSTLRCWLPIREKHPFICLFSNKEGSCFWRTRARGVHKRDENGKVLFFQMRHPTAKNLLDWCVFHWATCYMRLVIVFSTVHIWIGTVVMTNHYYAINKTLSRLCWSTEHKTNSKF